MDESKRFLIDTIYNSRGLKQYTSDLNRAKQVSNTFSISLSKQAQILEQTTTRSFNKQGQEIVRTTAILEDHGKKVRVVYDNIAGKTKEVSATFTKFTGGVAKAGLELKKLVSRAGLVIPVWLLLRSTMTGTLRVIQESIKFMIEWEYQLAQIRIVSNEGEVAIQELSQSLLNLSKTLGISSKELGEGCFDDQTEILTDSGWKFFKDLTYDDKVLSMNPENRQSEFMKIKNIVSYDYEGDLYCYDDKINFNVTPNHRFLYSDSHMRKWMKDEIRNISYNKWYVPVASSFIGNDIKKSWEFVLDDSKKTIKTSTENFMCFLGWYLSEGCSWKDKRRKDSYRFNIAQTKNHNFFEIENILINMGFSGKYKKSAKGFTHANKALVKYLMENCYISGEAKNCFSKKIPEEVKSYSKNSLTLLLNALIKGDGHIYDNKSLKVYFTSSKQLADDVQEIALKCGYSVNITKNNKDLFCVWLSSSKNRRIYSEKIKKEFYNNKVYCVEVEPYHTICVRRNGSAYWTLNSKLYAQQGRSIKEILPLMEATARLSLLTGRSIVESVEDMTAVLKAYKLEASNATSVVDQITNVMLHHAITAGDLASAYKQVASTASSLGVSLEALTGYITAIKVVTRDAGGKIGQSLRTMFSRISTSSASAIQELTGIPLFLDETGKVTTTTTANLRNLDVVLGELASKFKTLGSAQQAQLAKLIGGVRRQNQVYALFNNFTEAISSQADALFSLGEADKAINTLTDNMELRIERLQGTWEQFVNAVADTKQLKQATGALNDIIDTLTFSFNRRAFETNVMKEQLTELQKQGTEQENFGKSVEKTVKIANDLVDSYKNGRKTLAEVNTEAEILASKLNRIGKDFGYTVENVQTPQDLLKELSLNQNKTKELIINAKIKIEKSQLKSELLTVSNQIKAVIEKQTINLPINDNSLKALEKIVNIIKTGNLDQLSKNLSLEGTPERLTKINNLMQKLLKTSKEREGFQKLINDFNSIGKQIANTNDLESKFLKQYKEERSNINEKNLSQIKTEDIIKSELLNKEQELASKNVDKLQVTKALLSILNQNNTVLSEEQIKQRDNLEVELKKLETKKQQFELQLKQEKVLSTLKLEGASNLQLAIQELAFLKQRGETNEVILKQEQKINELRATSEIDVLQQIISAETDLLRTQGASELQIIKTRLEMEKKLGIEKKGIDYLKEQFQLQQAITKENQKTNAERLVDLKNAIIAKKKEKQSEEQSNSLVGRQRQSDLEQRAREAGLSQNEIDRILKPTEGIKSDLPNALKNVSVENVNLKDSLFSLKNAIEVLTKEIINQRVSTPLIPSTSIRNENINEQRQPIIQEPLGNLPKITKGMELQQTNGNKLIEINVGNTQVVLSSNISDKKIQGFVKSALNEDNDRRIKLISDEIAKQLRSTNSNLNRAEKDNFYNF